MNLSVVMRTMMVIPALCQSSLASTGWLAGRLSAHLHHAHAQQRNDRHLGARLHANVPQHYHW